MKLLLLAAGTALVAGKCANDCSNHGNCNAKNQCECHRNFFGPDCSSRLCPEGRAFIDSAVGDVNSDNSVGVDLVFAQGRSASARSELFSYQYAAARDSHDVTASWDEAHFYQQCSSKGVCDTTTGVCACFPGYEGAGCARKSCENDCAGHGACKNYHGTAYNMWDAEATLYCDCDAGYTGPGCEKRVCPSGVDPVQASNIDSSRLYRIAFRTLSEAATDFDAAHFYQVPFGPVTWTITLTDEFGDEWTTSMLTTNYDVIVDSADLAIYSMPIIAAGVMNTLGTDDDEDSMYSVDTAEPLAATYNAFGDGNYHVAAQVKDALDALPNSAAGSVTVHEVYASPAVDQTAAPYLLSSIYAAPFTGQANEDFHLEWPFMCGREDIYISGQMANAKGAIVTTGFPSIAGCGVATLDKEVGSAACAARSGNYDISDAIDGTGGYSGATISEQSSDMPLNVVYDVEAGVMILPMDSAAVGFTLALDGDAATIGGFPLFDAPTIYYQWPHFSNADDATERFPLFEDLEESCTNQNGIYAASTTYFKNNFAFDTTGTISGTAGLTLFLRFDSPSIDTAPRVDYTFSNHAAQHFLNAPLFSPAGGTLGEEISGVSNVDPEDFAGHHLVRVEDFGGDRSWDVAYHGRRAYFLEDGSDTSEGVGLHACSKRGLCDYESGLCDCFNGFTGANCDVQHALAF